MNALEMFLTRHAAVHATLETRLLGSLTDEQVRMRPAPPLNSLVWLLWHMARAEDIGVNLLVTDGRQVLDDDWLLRLNVSRRDVATGMTDDEVSEFSASVNIPALRDYVAAVGQRTREVVQALRPEDMDSVLEPSYTQRVLSTEGLIGDNAAWLTKIFDGRMRGDILAQLGLVHTATHLGEALVTRSFLGFRGR